ncbi:heme NO-binding domain-containing protein [Sulfurimonas microaerophilic]|uniref:heme NO-binding domain-containing protein n=1 Tax=Sulfurimonas microaerophilic TaxID=3058392 RepID=UPI0027152003|nr:heme NO-binding domain-containing protein [Sulfurimonas sp. hsl 1-7]
MRGIIFRTYIDFIKDKFGYTTLDELLNEKEYPNKGGFSSAANYSSEYLFSLIDGSTRLFDNSREKVIEAFGEYAFKYLLNMFKHSYKGANTPLHVNNPYDFLEKLNVIHFDELKKLYPDAKFPKFIIERKGDEHIVIEYASPRNIPGFVCGLMRGCLKYFNDSSRLTMNETKRYRVINNIECQVYVFEVKNNA